MSFLEKYAAAFDDEGVAKASDLVDAAQQVGDKDEFVADVEQAMKDSEVSPAVIDPNGNMAIISEEGAVQLLAGTSINSITAALNWGRHFEFPDGYAGPESLVFVKAEAISDEELSKLALADGELDYENEA